MSLKVQVDENLKIALKEGRELEVSVLRLLKATVLNKEKEKRYQLSRNKSEAEIEKMGKESTEANQLEKDSQLSDEEIIDTISSEIKKRKESIELYERGKRPELAAKEQKEIVILQTYLPEQISQEEIAKIIADGINKAGAKEIKDMGKVMAQISPQLKGKADMTLVSKIVKEKLS
jgi:uncharacterized protein